MLGKIRKQTQTYAANFIILATAAVMTLWGVGKMGGDKKGTDGAAAWVNGELISRREFAQEYEARLGQYQAMLGNQFDPKFLEALQIPQRTLDELVQVKLLGQQARKLGIVVPDAELADHIRSTPYFQKAGKFDPELYSKLPNRGLEEKKMRERLQVSRFYTYLADRIRLTPTAARHAYLLSETKADVELARIDFGAIAKAQTFSAAQVAAKASKATEENLKQTYESHLNEYSTPSQVELRQIRVGIPYQAAEDVKIQAGKKIREIRAALTPENFAEKAKAQSDDEHAKAGGALGWVDPSTLAKPLAEAVAKLPVGKVSEPVETDTGAYVFLVSAKKDRTTQPFESVRKSLAEVWAKEKLADEFAQELKSGWEKKLAAGQDIRGEFKKYKVDIKKTGPFAISSGYLPQVGQDDEMLNGILSLTTQKPLAPKLFAHGNEYYYAKLLTLSKADESAFMKNEATASQAASNGLRGEFMNTWLNGLKKNASIKTELGGSQQHAEETADL